MITEVARDVLLALIFITACGGIAFTLVDYRSKDRRKHVEAVAEPDELTKIIMDDRRPMWDVVQAAEEAEVARWAPKPPAPEMVIKTNTWVPLQPDALTNQISMAMTLAKFPRLNVDYCKCKYDSGEIEIRSGDGVVVKKICSNCGRTIMPKPLPKSYGAVKTAPRHDKGVGCTEFNEITNGNGDVIRKVCVDCGAVDFSVEPKHCTCEEPRTGPVEDFCYTCGEVIQ
jgi:hypothetical protein